MKYKILLPWHFEKKSPLLELFSFYEGRFKHFESIEVLFLGGQNPWASCEKEILKSSKPLQVCLLDEKGVQLSSSSFSQKLQDFENQSYKECLFIIGDAYGLPKELHKIIKNPFLISFSVMTFPHEIAALLLMEQLYRAKCILQNHPYHHGDISPFVKEWKK